MKKDFCGLREAGRGKTCAIFSPKPTRVLSRPKISTCQAADFPTRNFRCECESVAASDGQSRRSCGGPDDFFLRRVRARSNNQERFGENESAGRVAGRLVEVQEAMRGTAKFSGLELKRRAP